MKYKYEKNTNHNLIRKMQDADSLSPHGRLSLYPPDWLLTGPVMNIHNMIYNIILFENFNSRTTGEFSRLHFYVFEWPQIMA